MQRSIHLSIIIIFACLLAGSFALLQAQLTQAQIDGLTYFIPLNTDDLNDMYDLASNEEASSNTCTTPGDDNIEDQPITTTIVIAVERSNSIIYYDHWEDGYEADLTSPTQATTQVWGDGNTANGSLPATNPPNTSGSDTLTAGQVIILFNEVNVPRTTTEFFFDGGDKVTSTGGYLSVTRSAWPKCSGVLFAGAWELYPTIRWGTDYKLPVAEDLVGDFAGFGSVDFSVQAAVDNTTVEFDLDGDGTFGGPADLSSVILSQGQSHVVTKTFVTGAEVRTTSPDTPVQIQMMAGDPLELTDRYEARAYTLIPTDQFSNNYISPRSSDGRYWLYNPNAITITVNPSTNAGAGTPFDIGPNSTVSFDPTGIPFDPTTTGVRFQSADNFYGLVTLDSSFTQDWGFALQPVDNLTSQVVVSWGVGNNGVTNNFSHVFVTALQTTTIHVDYNNDGMTETTFIVTPLEEVAITDPDFDMSGARLFTIDKTPFVSAWGQDQFAPAAGTSIDVGTNVVPLPSLGIEKLINLHTDADNSGTITWGDTVEFSVVLFNDSALNLDPITIIDNLPASVIYDPNTSAITSLTGSTAIPDDASGTAFPFDVAGTDVPGGLNSQETVTATFRAIVQANNDDITNSATVSTPALVPEEATVSVPLSVARYELDKKLVSPADGVVEAGDIITFSLTLTSTGNISITTLPLRDNFNATYVTFLNAITTSPDSTSTGIITWTNLADNSIFGPFDPGDRIEILTSFLVNPVPDTLTNTTNTASVNGAVGADGAPIPDQSDPAEILFVTPTPTSTPTPTVTPTPDPNTGSGSGGSSDDDDDDGGSGAPTPTPTSASTGGGIVSGVGESGLGTGSGAAPGTGDSTGTGEEMPVTLLPATGVREGQSLSMFFNLLVVISLTSVLLIFWLKHQRTE